MSEVVATGCACTRRGPLEGASLPSRHEFSVRAAPPATRAILRGGADAAAAASGALGLAVPAGPNRAARNAAGGRAAIALGPDEWLVIAADGGALLQDLEARLAGIAHSLVDVSHRQVGLTLSGRLATRVLSAGCPLDLRVAAFPIGMATRTIFMKAEIVLWRQAEDRFHVEVWRSFAEYLAGHLSLALAGTHGLASTSEAT